MLWEGRSLRDIREADVRAVVASGLREHLHLEYKSDQYDNADRGRKEFLLDVCMFANASGGILLIGVPERRAGDGQPTGIPDPAAVLGLEIPNPEAVLAAYDARVMESIEERLPLESVAIALGDGRQVLAFRTGNSAIKPHSVRHLGHIYFPSRRERQRYSMNVREIKELVIRTASRLDQAQEILTVALNTNVGQPSFPLIRIAMLPVFFEEFSVNVSSADVRRLIGEFSPRGVNNYREPDYSFKGIERNENHSTVTFQRNGLLSLQVPLPLYPALPGEQQRQHVFGAVAIDIFLRNFLLRAAALFEAAAVAGPFLLGMQIENREPLSAAYPLNVGGYEAAGPIPAASRLFPFMQIVDFGRIDEAMRPLCDQAHQMFGRARSTAFDNEGRWVGR